MNKLTCAVFLWIIIFSSQTNLFSQTNDVLIANARAAIEKNDNATALISLGIVLKRSPNDEAGLTQRSRVYVRQSKFAEAMADAAKVLAKNPNNHEALNVRGVVKRERDKDLNGALADFTRAVTIQPDFFLGWVNVGFSNLSLKKPAEAFAAYKRAIEISPNDRVGYDRRGVAYLQSRKYKEAIADFDKSLSITGDNEGTYINRGYSHFRIFLDGSKPSRELAMKDLEKTLAMNPNNSVALGIRSLFRYEDGNFDGATADANKSLIGDPNMFLALVARGLIKTYANKTAGNYDYNSGLEDFDKAKKAAPNDAWVDYQREFSAQKATSPLAALIREDMKREKETKEANALAVAKVKLEAAKQKVIKNPWDWNSYVQLDDAFAEAKTSNKDFYTNFARENPGNICATIFKDEIRHFSPSDQLHNYKSVMDRFDGTNGKTCAAFITIEIARAHIAMSNYEMARTYIDRAKAIESNLKFIDNATVLLESGLAEERRLKAASAKASNQAGRSDLVAGLTPEQREKAAEMSKRWDADEKKVNEVANALTPVWKRRLELEQSFSKLNDKLQSDTKNRLTYAVQMKKDAEEIVMICEQFLSKYGTELGKTDLPSLNAKVDVINQQIREMRSEIVKNKKNIEQLEKIIKETSQP